MRKGNDVVRERAITEVTEQLRALGVEPGDILLVHTSFRATRPVEGGPSGLIQALKNVVGEQGTLVMPSWGDDDDTPLDPRSTPASEDLGVVANTFWRQPGVERSSHALAFAAWGPRAMEIVDGPLPTPPHSPDSPVGRVHDLDGKVLLLGVNHDANTTVHLAELLAGVPYRVQRHSTVLVNGQQTRVDYGENDHCCDRFKHVDDWLREGGLQAEGPVGHANARLTRSRDVVRVVTEQLKQDILFFLHSTDAGCEECDEARASV